TTSGANAGRMKAGKMSSWNAGVIGVVAGALAFAMSVPQERPVLHVAWWATICGALLSLIVMATKRLKLNEPGFSYALIGDAVIWLPLGVWIFVDSLWDGFSIATALAGAVLYQGLAFLGS